jgi:uncharacterized protein YjbJ (UPF0337 family)
MNKDRVMGAGKKITGSIKEAAGQATGDTKLEATGTAEKTTGNVQSAAVKAKDAVQDSVKK